MSTMTTASTTESIPDFSRFAIGFDHRDRGRLHALIDEVFDSERIADYCRERGIFLIEDCAHAHGASWNGRTPGAYGDAGIYSLYATKTISTGEGGVLVSRRPEVIEHARAFRNYGKPDFGV